MPENRQRYVVLCQQMLALATVLAVSAPAAGVVTLEIVAPVPGSAPVRQVDAAQVATGETPGRRESRAPSSARQPWSDWPR